MIEQLKTVKIKGKDYVEVFERLRYFRESEKYKGYSMTDEIVSHENGSITIKTTIYNPEGRAVATGIANEVEGRTPINKTSYVENCETSAWGRALANLGIGISNAVASAEEMQNAMLQQEEMEKAKKDSITDADRKLMEEASAAFDAEFGTAGPVLCPVCGKRIEGARGKGGKEWTPEEILLRYGMCGECYRRKDESGDKN